MKLAPDFLRNKFHRIKFHRKPFSEL